MKLQYTLLAVLTVLSFSVCSETNAQFFRNRFRQPAQPTYNAYPYAPMVSQTPVQTQPIQTQPAAFTQTVQNSAPVIQNTIPTIQNGTPIIQNGTTIIQGPLPTMTAVRNSPKVYSPNSYKDLSSGKRYATNRGESYRKNDKYFETDLRHVYRPIKGGMEKEGSNGQTLILAEYIGTHRKSANEQRTGDFQDMQHGSMGQNLVKTDLSGKEMWVEPFLDGTLRWVPLILKN